MDILLYCIDCSFTHTLCLNKVIASDRCSSPDSVSSGLPGTRAFFPVDFPGALAGGRNYDLVCREDLGPPSDSSSSFEEP